MDFSVGLQIPISFFLLSLSLSTGNLGRVDYISEFELDLFIRPDTCNPRFRVWFNFTVEHVRETQVRPNRDSATHWRLSHKSSIIGEKKTVLFDFDFQWEELINCSPLLKYIIICKNIKYTLQQYDAGLSGHLGQTSHSLVNKNIQMYVYLILKSWNINLETEIKSALVNKPWPVVM